MRNWLIAAAAPLVLLAGSVASAAEFRDDAKLFKPDVAAQAAKSLESIERSTKVPIDIETVASIGDEPIADVTKRRASKTGDRGVFILIAKDKKKIDIVVSREYANVFPHERRVAIHDVLKKAFDKPGGPNANVVAGIEEIGILASDAMAASGGPSRRVNAAAPPANRRAEVPPPAPRPVGGVPQRAGAGSGLIGGLIVLGGIILVVLIVVRILGAVFRGASGGGYGNQQMGGPGYGPGPGGPGYGPGPGYGGGYGGGNRGGGFMSSLFGGIGGAMAGNWIYDQMSGRNRGYETPHETTSGNLGDGGYYGGTAPAGGGEDWVGGESTTWGDNSGGGDTGGGGGDWGGTDVAGGDWGGGGGGGGGGDEGGWS